MNTPSQIGGTFYVVALSPRGFVLKWKASVGELGCD